MAALPEVFLDTMQKMLGEEYRAYLDSMNAPSHVALRVNRRRISPEAFAASSPFSLRPVSWASNGFYYDPDRDNPSRHPYYYAGVYYIQEPSAMIPAQILPVHPGERVLDLCAAPGGKATELAAKLNGDGILVANDISASRAMALAKNLQMAGAENAVVTAETPERLAEKLPGFFDKILIDAPCSGEGMFRRDPSMIKSWLAHGPAYYAQMQREILQYAYQMLRPGGQMVYSTCTFSPQEDEGMIQSFLTAHPDMTICEVPWREGYSHGRPEWADGGSDALCRCVRIFPHRAEGEGHFAVLLQKRETDVSENADTENDIALQTEERMDRQKRVEKESRTEKRNGKQCSMHTKNMGLAQSGKSSRYGKSPEYKKNSNHTKTQAHGDDRESLEAFLQEFTEESGEAAGEMYRKKDTCVRAPLESRYLQGLRILSEGVIYGKETRGRFMPSPQLALTLDDRSFRQTVCLSPEDPRTVRYLKGETITVENPLRGYVLVCVDRFPLGWCRGDGTGRLKNKYHPGWRML